MIVVDGSPARAYPLRYLDFHEIVNADRDGHPVAVTWCPLCGTAVAYDRVVDGRTLTFGVSGKLVQDNLVMYDRETDSLWRQSTGVAIDGPMEGTELSTLPAWVTTFDRLHEVRPEGQVLEPPGGESEAAGPGVDPEPIDYGADTGSTSRATGSASGRSTVVDRGRGTGPTSTRRPPCSASNSGTTRWGSLGPHWKVPGASSRRTSAPSTS